MSWDRIAGVLLAPLLLGQALRVRARIPPIPEALGPHTGTCGTGPALRLLFVGDSSMAGVGAAHMDDALPGQVLQALSPHHSVTWHMHARSSATTASTLRTLPPHPCDVAIVALGVNDLTRLVPLRRWRDQTAALIEALIGCGAQQVHLSAMPPVDRFPVLPQPLAGILGAQAARMSAALDQLGARYPEAEVHHLPDLPLTPAHIARDGFHPGPETYRVWGDLIGQAILRKRDNLGAAPT